MAYREFAALLSENVKMEYKINLGKQRLPQPYNGITAPRTRTGEHRWSGRSTAMRTNLSLKFTRLRVAMKSNPEKAI